MLDLKLTCIFKGSPECKAAVQNLRKCDPLPTVISAGKSVHKMKIGGRSSQLSQNDEEKRRPIIRNMAHTKKKQQG